MLPPVYKTPNYTLSSPSPSSKYDGSFLCRWAPLPYILKQGISEYSTAKDS